MSEKNKAASYAAAERRIENADYQESWTLRGLTIALVVSLAANLCLAAGLITLGSMKQTVPYLVQFEQEGQRVAVMEPLTGRTGTTTGRMLLEAGLRQYIVMRNEVLPIERVMLTRWRRSWNFIDTHSSRDVYEQFVSETEPILQGLDRTSRMREVVLGPVTEIQAGVWRIEYRTVDRHARTNAFSSAATETEDWVAHIQVGRKYYEQRPRWVDVLRNPLGFVVSSYRVDRRLPDATPAAG